MFVAVLLGATLAGSPAAAPSAHAQNTPPAVYFGVTTPGAEVAAYIGGQLCGSTTADAAGEWVVLIPDDAGCVPSDGAVVEFTLDGQAATETEIWNVGVGPADPVFGTPLTVGPGGGTPGPGSPGDGVIVGTLPAQGFGLVTFGGTFDQLRAGMAAVSCEAPIFATGGGAFVVFIPTTTVEAVNAGFSALFPGGVVPPLSPLLGGNCAAS